MTAGKAALFVFSSTHRPTLGGALYGTIVGGSRQHDAACFTAKQALGQGNEVRIRWDEPLAVLDTEKQLRMSMNHTRVMLIWSVSIITGAVVQFAPVMAGPKEYHRNYTYIYFENGYPTPLRGRRPQEQANLPARANPDLVVQTGFYSLKLDCDDVKLTGYDALPGSDYITALNEDVTVFSPANLLLGVTKDGISYTCTSGIVQDRDRQYVRLIESGQFVQRFDHVGLVFTAANGDVLEKAGRLEVTAWPDHVVFCLDLSKVPGVTETSLQLTSPAGRSHRAITKGRRATLALQPHLDREYAAIDAASHVGEASSLETGKKAGISF